MKAKTETPDPKPGAPVRMTDERWSVYERVHLQPLSNLSREEMVELFDEARRAREEVECWKTACQADALRMFQAMEERDAAVKERDEARAEAAWDDKPTKYDEAIAAAHPTRTKEYRRYDLAVELVGAKRSKYALVDLVNWCLSTHPETEALRSDLQAARDRIGALTEAIDGHDQCENGDLVADVTACIRRADLRFEKSGGSSRHWVRECMLPELNAARFVVVRRAALAPAPGEAPTRKDARLDMTCMVLPCSSCEGVQYRGEDRVCPDCNGTGEEPRQAPVFHLEPSRVDPNHILKSNGDFIKCINCGLAEWDLKHPCEPSAPPVAKGGEG